MHRALVQEMAVILITFLEILFCTHQKEAMFMFIISVFLEILELLMARYFKWFFFLTISLHKHYNNPYSIQTWEPVMAATLLKVHFNSQCINKKYFNNNFIYISLLLQMCGWNGKFERSWLCWMSTKYYVLWNFRIWSTIWQWYKLYRR